MLSEEFTAPEFWTWAPTRYGNMLNINYALDSAVLSKENDHIRDTFDSFSAWLKENNLKAIGYDRTSFHLAIEGAPANLRYRPNIYYNFEVYKDDSTWPYGPDEHWQDKPFNCGTCGSEEHSYSLFCHNCEDLTLFWCSNCGRNREAAHFDPTSDLTLCANCGVQCACGRYHGGYLNSCVACVEAFRCGNCGGWTNDALQPVTDEPHALECCETCHNCFCIGCRHFSGPVNEDKLCNRCVLLGEDGDKEIFDDADMAGTKLMLPTIPGREMIRLTGVEIEGGLGLARRNPVTGFSGPNSLARALYDQGLSQTREQMGYHHGRGFARIETDSSCDWECVIGPIDMANLENVRQLNNVVKTIKGHIKSDLLKLDLRCGTHVHVGAERVSLGQAFNLHLLYTYLEDPLYRLGAAHWPIHRTLINDESHSAARSPKETTKTKFARRFAENRYYGLSFSNYFEKMLDECHCGAARYGAFEECSCDLHKCTFEFRLFNATANTVKLHAYIALCQALVAKAISMPEVKDATAYEEMPFVTSRLRDMDGNKQAEMFDKWDDRLRFIATELPLTQDEKKSIFYCIKNSELVKVDSAKELFTGTER
jgi:hypothetical protein